MVLTRYYALNPEIQISVFLYFYISVSGVLGGHEKTAQACAWAVFRYLVELIDELDDEVGHGLAGHGCMCLQAGVGAGR